jgi:hypothetical protein
MDLETQVLAYTDHKKMGRNVLNNAVNKPSAIFLAKSLSVLKPQYIFYLSMDRDSEVAITGSLRT